MIKLIKVDFPDPVFPTIPIKSPLLISRLIFFKINLLLFLYLKLTFSNFIFSLKVKFFYFLCSFLLSVYQNSLFTLLTLGITDLRELR